MSATVSTNTTTNTTSTDSPIGTTEAYGCAIFCCTSCTESTDTCNNAAEYTFIYFIPAPKTDKCDDLAVYSEEPIKSFNCIYPTQIIIEPYTFKNRSEIAASKLKGRSIWFFQGEEYDSATRLFPPRAQLKNEKLSGVCRVFTPAKIAGIVIGSIAVCAILTVIIWLIVRRRRRSKVGK
jgi:hypothetical protein